MTREKTLTWPLWTTSVLRTSFACKWNLIILNQSTHFTQMQTHVQYTGVDTWPHSLVVYWLERGRTVYFLFWCIYMNVCKCQKHCFIRIIITCLFTVFRHYCTIKAKHYTVIHASLRKSYCKCTVVPVLSPCLFKSSSLSSEAINTLSFLEKSCG